jgi:PAS domain S-box-containing protein
MISGSTQSVNARARELFSLEADALHRRTDRLFAYLMIAEWGIAFVLAVVVSPGTWSGQASDVHPDVVSAIVLGGLLTIFPVAVAWAKPGALVTRTVFAVAQMLWSALFIRLTHDRLETHFHILVSLVCIAFYKDWRILVPATLVVASDHFFRGTWFPESAYGILQADSWRFVEHAGWVLLEDVCLFTQIGWAVANQRDLAQRQAELELANASIERQVRDRTRELEASREQFRSLLETTQAVPCELDASTLEIRYIGPQLSRMLGYTDDLPLTGDVLGERVHADDLGLLMAAFRRSADGEGTLHVDYRMQALDGRWLWFRSVMARALDMEERAVVRIITIDVTEHKQLEAELRHAQKLESVGRLASGVAHEINTPIQFVSDSTHFVKESMTEFASVLTQYRDLRARLEECPVVEPSMLAAIAKAEEAADLDYLLENVPAALDRALEGLGRVAHIVRSMKDFAHPDGTDKRDTDLNQAITSTLAIAKNEYKYVAELSTDFGDIPKVRCFASEINQVVLNLVVNAAHAIQEVVGTTGNMGAISVRTRVEGADVIVDIQDSGSGIPPEVRDKLFDPFFTTKEVGKGTGQGLAIARSVVVKHGGALTFETEVGKGTTFSLRLPISGDNAHPVAA